MTHGRAARGPGGHEAAGHAQPARRCRPSTSSPRRRRSRSRSAPTSPPCRPWAWWPRRWWRSCWPARRCASSAATRSTSSSRNADALPCHASEHRGRSSAHLVLVGHDGDRARPPSAALSRRACTGRSSTATRWSRPAPGAPCARSSRPTARPPSAPLETDALLEALAAPTPAVIAAAGGVVLAAANRDAPGRRRRRAVVWLRADPTLLAERAVRRRPPAAARRRPGGQPAPPARASGAPLYAEVADDVVDVDGQPVDRRRGRPCSRRSATDGPCDACSVPLGDRSYDVLVGAGRGQAAARRAAGRRPAGRRRHPGRHRRSRSSPGVEHRGVRHRRRRGGQVAGHRRGPVPRLRRGGA